MSSPVRVRHTSTRDLAGGRIPDEQVITLIFRTPVDGTDLTVKVKAFQCLIGQDMLGAGIYVSDGDGREVSGTVLRWQQWRTPHDEPQIIRWQAPHCEDDDCGRDCGHERPRR